MLIIKSLYVNIFSIRFWSALRIILLILYWKSRRLVADDIKIDSLNTINIGVVGDCDCVAVAYTCVYIFFFITSVRLTWSRSRKNYWTDCTKAWCIDGDPQYQIGEAQLGLIKRGFVIKIVSRLFLTHFGVSFCKVTYAVVIITAGRIFGERALQWIRPRSLQLRALPARREPVQWTYSAIHNYDNIIKFIFTFTKINAWLIGTYT